jgi:hypothetical protein
LRGRGRVVREGQDHAGGDDAPIAHDRRAIVQRRVGVEEVDQELSRQQSVDRDPPLDIILKPGFPLEHDQRPIPVPSKLRGRFYQLVDRASGHFVPAGEKLRKPGAGLPELLEGAPDLRLKNDRQ